MSFRVINWEGSVDVELNSDMTFDPSGLLGVSQSVTFGRAIPRNTDTTPMYRYTWFFDSAVRIPETVDYVYYRVCPVANSCTGFDFRLHPTYLWSDEYQMGNISCGEVGMSAGPGRDVQPCAWG